MLTPSPLSPPGELLANIDTILPYADDDDVMADLLEYLPYFAPRLDELAPHLPLLRQHLPTLMPALPAIYRYTDRFIPYPQVSANVDVLIHYFGWGLRVPLIRRAFLLPGVPRAIAWLAPRLPKRRLRKRARLKLLAAAGGSLVFATVDGEVSVPAAEVPDHIPANALLTALEIPVAGNARLAFDRSLKPVVSVAVGIDGDRATVAIGCTFDHPICWSGPVVEIDTCAEMFPDPKNNPMGSAAYRRRMIGVLARRLTDKLKAEAGS